MSLAISMTTDVLVIAVSSNDRIEDIHITHHSKKKINGKGKGKSTKKKEGCEDREEVTRRR